MSVTQGLTHLHCTFTPMIKCTKPPLGVIPKWLHDERRAEELKAAIDRRLSANWHIPPEWIEEYNLLIRQLTD
ncbi:hypothetical protein ACQP3R_00265 [Bacillus inaquosorum]|uniref:hypothetical protein n=1 Tax=Bacillus inaquosorum TaxID=483913 RepID=UPI003CFEFC46